jgi:hypothetical protein
VSAEPQPPSPRDEFFGEWRPEKMAEDELDRRVEASGLFKIYRQVEGAFRGQRPGRSSQAVCIIDRILIPTKKLRDAGWRLPIGVEIKASGEKCGPAIAQAIDYTNTAFCVDVDDWNTIDVVLRYVFLWPLEKRYRDLESITLQQGIGCIYETSSAALIFQLERQVIRVNRDGSIQVSESNTGRKVGSR